MRALGLSWLGVYMSGGGVRMQAVQTVQRAAGALLVRWNNMGARARRWTAWREVLRERGKVVLHAWKVVCERQKGTWRVSSRQGREREVWAGARMN